ncbi:MAG TPA: hypothetical protein VLU24_04605 [Mycobacterium sp.]|nr:hypothetical protein [Mycobacterium sp.]
MNKLGPWAPWLGVAVYAFGIMVYLGQLATNLVFGSHTSGFGSCSALMLCAMVTSLRA